MGSKKAIAILTMMVLSAFWGVAPRAVAHHSIAGEYGGAANELSRFIAEVTTVRWTSPHIELYVTVKDGDLPAGEEWVLNSHAPGLLARTYGIMPGEVSVGDDVVIYGWRSLYDVPRMHMRAIGVNEGPIRSTHRGRDERDLEAGQIGDITPSPGLDQIQGSALPPELGGAPSDASDYGANIAGAAPEAASDGGASGDDAQPAGGGMNMTIIAVLGAAALVLVGLVLFRRKAS